MRRTIRAGVLLSMIWGASGCQGAEDVGRAAQAVTAPAETVLGFEDATLWHGAGLVGASPEHTQGSSSLAVQPTGYSPYRSDAFHFEGTARKILFDLKMPPTQPNPSWFGQTQVFLESPSKGLYNAYVGQVELTGRPLGVFDTLSLDVPSWMASLLAPGADDLRVTVVLLVPGSPGTYLLDNLRIRTELLLHYAFDADGGGSVIDTSGWDRHGALRGAAALSASGRTGSALRLDGSSGYVEIPSGLTDGVRELTVAAWVNLDNNRAWSRIFDLGGQSGFAYLTPSTHDGLLRYSAYAGYGVEGTVTAPSLPAGAWKHVAVTTRGRDYRVFVDGVEAASALTIPTAPGDLGADDQGNWIGRSRFPDPLLAGKIDDFRVYDRVLGQPEIAALAAPQRDYAAWRFDEGAGTAVRDSSALALDGTLVGGTASWVPGLVGQALRLHGDGASVQLPSGIAQGCADFTLAAWVNLHSNKPWNRVFDFGKPDASSFMYLSPAGFGPSGQELRFGLVAPTGVSDVGFPFTMPLGEWTHLAVVLRGDTASLFLNGRAVRRQTVVTNPSDLGLTTGDSFGKSTFPDPTFDGALDDVRLSCRAFDDREIAHLAHLPAPSRLPAQLPATGAVINVHDPSILRADGVYHLFSTGAGLRHLTSPDLAAWTDAGRVFGANPAWITERFGELGSLWAPDISSFGGVYHLYYAASTFGSNHSCIGHATKASLSSSDPWADLGPVICSNDNGSVDNWNAIDPNVALDAQGRPFLAFGSFWGGLELIALDPSGARADTAITRIASRPETSIEAPFIVQRGSYYYLFASFDSCCRGADSTYNVRVGRSTSLQGPYLDRTGLDMMRGGGTMVLSGDSRWRGPGHNAVLERGDDDYVIVYHAYDALNGGTPNLRVAELVWQEGWPVAAEP